MKPAGLGVLLAGTLLFASPAAADVVLTMNDGHVTLSASNATVRQILAEWARVGQTKIVNADRVAGSALTLELTNVSELEALEIILRSVSGYLLAPRRVAAPNASRYDRILILPTSAPTTASRPGAMPAPVFSPPSAPPQVRRPDDDPDDAPADEPTPPVVTPAARPPVFNTFPQPQPASEPPSEPSAPMPFTTPSVSGGVPVPGMVAPTPQSAPGVPTPGAPPQ